HLSNAPPARETVLAGTKQFETTIVALRPFWGGPGNGEALSSSHVSMAADDQDGGLSDNDTSGPRNGGSGTFTECRKGHGTCRRAGSNRPGGRLVRYQPGSPIGSRAPAAQPVDQAYSPCRLLQGNRHPRSLSPDGFFRQLGTGSV